RYCPHRALHSFPTRRSSDLAKPSADGVVNGTLQSQNLARANTQPRALSDKVAAGEAANDFKSQAVVPPNQPITVSVSEQLEGKRSEEHTSELQSLRHLVCRL